MAVKFGIIGCGNISKKFSDAVNQSENASLVAVAASDKKRADNFAKLFDVQTAFGSYDEIIADNSVDIIYIGLTNNLHYAISKKCIINEKNVLCEKPLTLTYEETKELCELAKKHNVLFMEAMWTRCLPSYQKAKSWVKDGKIGRVSLIEADFCIKIDFDENHRVFNNELGGGALYDLGVYPIAFAPGILDKKPIDVKSTGFIGKTGVDEYSVITMKFDDGEIGVLKSAATIKKPIEARIYGENGYIVVDNFNSSRDCHLYDINDNLLETFHDEIENGFVHEVNHVVEMFSSGKNESWLFPYEDSVYSAKLISDCLKEWKS